MVKPQPESLVIYNYYDVQNYIFDLLGYDHSDGKWWNYILDYQWPELVNDSYQEFKWNEDTKSEDPTIIAIAETLIKEFGDNILFYVSW